MVREAAAHIAFAGQVQPNANSDAELVRLAQANSRDAWEAIYRAHYPTLYRYVRGRVVDRDQAEDLTSTVFLEAAKSIGSYESRGRPLLAWLYAIARNQVNYYYRASSRKRTRVLMVEGSGDVLGREDPQLGIERLDLIRAVNALPDAQREVIILRHVVGLTTPEIAHLLCKHERAVYSLQARGIKALRRRLT